jgi:tRNA 2-thiouridine synthesizing protein A
MKKLDLRGLKCPMPVLKTRKVLAGMAPGETVEVACTDPLSIIDLPNLVRETGDALESQSRSAGELLFLIRKAAT